MLLSRAWLLRVFLRLLIRVFPHVAVTCFSVLGWYVFSRAWQLHTEADKGRSQNILKIRKRKFKSEI